jgi:hypothetical protein
MGETIDVEYVWKEKPYKKPADNFTIKIKLTG